MEISTSFYRTRDQSIIVSNKIINVIEKRTLFNISNKFSVLILSIKNIY